MPDRRIYNFMKRHLELTKRKSQYTLAALYDHKSSEDLRIADERWRNYLNSGKLEIKAT